MQLRKQQTSRTMKEAKLKMQKGSTYQTQEYLPSDKSIHLHMNAVESTYQQHPQAFQKKSQ